MARVQGGHSRLTHSVRRQQEPQQVTYAVLQPFTYTALQPVTYAAPQPVTYASLQPVTYAQPPVTYAAPAAEIVQMQGGSASLPLVTGGSVIARPHYPAYAAAPVTYAAPATQTMMQYAAQPTRTAAPMTYAAGPVAYAAPATQTMLHYSQPATAFDVYDRKRDGVITRAEFGQLMRRVGYGFRSSILFVNARCFCHCSRRTVEFWTSSGTGRYTAAPST